MKLALTSVAAVAAALVAAAPASATVYNINLGTISTLPTSFSPGFSNVDTGSDTFNYNFTLTVNTAVNYSSFTSSPPPLTFTSAGIYSGTFTTTAPTTASVYGGYYTTTPDPNSPNGSTGISLPRAILAGSTGGTAYTISVTGNNSNGSMGTGVGSNLTFSSPAPEPATWGLMVLGFGAVGGALRTSRRKVLFA